MADVQQTLEGGETDAEREKPDTFRYCYECEEYVLRSRFGPHEDHDYAARKAANWPGDPDEEDEDDESVEKAGEWYDVELHYSVEYSFRVPAWSEHEAKDLAKELKWNAEPVDSYHVHTNVRNPWGMDDPEIYTDDPALPDDFDIYGDELLHDAIERAKEEAEDGD